MIVFSGCASKNDELYEAVLNQNMERVKSLIQAGADVNGAVYRGSSILHEAVTTGSLEIVKWLVKYGASLEGKNRYGLTPLLWGVYNGKTKGILPVLDFLIQSGSDLNAENKRGCNALALAVEENEREVVEFLLDQKMDVNAAGSGCEGKSPLSIAAYWGYQEIVRLLVERKADVNAKDRQGKSVLDWAKTEVTAKNQREMLYLSKETSQKEKIAEFLMLHGAKK